MKHHKTLTSILLTAVLTGCASHHYQAAVGHLAAISADQAYLYGRFKVEREFMLATQLSLQITNRQTGQELGLRFKSGEAVYAVAVPPGEYQMAHLVLAKAGPNLEFVGDYKRIPLAFAGDLAVLGMPFQVEAGKAYYVGDFLGVTRRSWGVGVVNFLGDLVNVTKSFKETTAELKQQCPQFNEVEARPVWGQN